MKIGGLYIPDKVFSAPMAGVTDAACRQIFHEFGAALTYTEMISAKGLCHGNDGTRFLLNMEGLQSPAAAQLFGRDPAVMAAAAEILQDYPAYGIIDINCGCPAPKIVKNGEGSALMREPELIGKIVKAVTAKSKGKPVTIKLRKGFDFGSETAVQAALVAMENGAAAVCIHGRTAKQMYSGTADWGIIRDVKRAVYIPVIGNGDINSPEAAKRMLDETGCDAVMIGRGIWGNPWLIQRSHKYIETGVCPPEPSLRERIELAVRHTETAVLTKGEHVGIQEMRRHLHMYTKGIRGSSEARVKINAAGSLEEIKEILMLLGTAP